MSRLLTILLITGAAWGGEPPAPRLLSFQMDETPASLALTLRSEPNVLEDTGSRVVRFRSAPSGADPADTEFEWEFFYSPEGALESVTWNSGKAVPADPLFPETERRVVKASGSKATVFVRNLPGGRILIAYVDDPHQTEIRQVLMVRASSLGRFFPWLEASDTTRAKAGTSSKVPTALAIRGLADRH